MRRASAALLVLGFVVLAPLDARSQSQVEEALVIPISQDDGSLTPYTFELAYPLVTLIYDTLMWRDEEGIPRPLLARDLSMSRDRRRISLELHQGVRWHDGQPFTADDVVFTFEFVRDHYHPRFTPQLAPVRAVRAVDPRKVVIELDHVALGFVDLPLADVPILPRHLWEGLSEDELTPPGLPIGTGPYRMSDRTTGGGYRFVANERYFKGPPLVEAIEVPVERSFDDTIDLIRRGVADMLPIPLPRDHAARLEGPSIAISGGSLYLGTVLMFNLRQAPFDDIEIRRAIAQALNLDAIARASRNGVPSDHGYLHPESEWAAKQPLHSYDPASAARLLRTLDIPPFDVVAPDNNPLALVAGRQVAIQLEAAGLDVELRRLRPKALAAAVGQDDAVADFDAAIWPSPMLASYDPDFLRVLFGSDPKESRLNYSGYASEDFDRAAERVASAKTAADRRRYVEQELQVLAAEVPHVPLFFPNGEFAYRPATYREWVYIEGSGIFDKRSFVPISGAKRMDPSPDPGGQRNAEDPEPVQTRPTSVQVIALALLVLAAALGLGGFIFFRR